MNPTIETMNHWGGSFLNFAWPMLWQSSLLIVVLFAIDFLIRRQIRASIRYALWLVVLVKLCLPPTLALPTSPAWWWPKTSPTAAAQPHYTVTYGTGLLPEISRNVVPVYAPPKPALTIAAWLLVASGGVSVLLLAWLLIRWRRVARQVRRATHSERLTTILNRTRFLVGTKSKVPVKLTENSMSPAVCGLFHPVILIPKSLADGFPDEQLRTVLLHELVHLQRSDVWLNFLQALLQVVYWWHPLLWLASARIRRVREEAVDDAVMLALRDQAESYAPTLLEVAKLALNRPLASLGLVGVLESRSALQQRVERLVNCRAPRKAGLTLVSLLGIATFAVVAVPMSSAPTETTGQAVSSVNGNLDAANSGVSVPANPSNRSSAAQSPVARTFKIYHPIGENDLKKLLLDAGVTIPPTIFLYRDNGILLVRGNAQQLELAHEVVLKLNGFSAKEVQPADSAFVRGLSIPTTNNGGPANLFSRTFKVEAYAFADAMRSVSGLKTDDVGVMAKSIFSKLGVDWESPEGKSVFYNDRSGLLYVRATESDLDTIEQAVQALNETSPLIHIKARFLEVPEGALSGFGKMIHSTNQPDQFVGILTSEDTKTALEALRSRYGVEEVSAPEVTTASGRQTEMRSTMIISVVTNFAFRETATNTAITPQTSTVETGPVLDAVAAVLPDGNTTDLKTTASVTEFLGYDQPTNTIVKYTASGKKINLPTVLPRFDIRKASARVKLWDGQTVVLGGLKPHFYDDENEVAAEPDYFRKTTARGHSEEQEKELLVFITVTLVDPTGNRIHSEDEMQFARNAIPPQDGP